ncbi:MAG: peptidoglycan DD-metalloendopeptidase family protein [Dysosmobacter welbionis]
MTYVNGHERERDILSSTTVREATEKVVAGHRAPPLLASQRLLRWPCYGRITPASATISLALQLPLRHRHRRPLRHSPVKAADGGTVTFAGYKGSYGYLVIIDHGNGEQTYYGHNSSLLVSAGDKVYQGQTIAKAGSTGRSTGSHCHFEIRVNGTQVNPSAYLN